MKKSFFYQSIWLLISFFLFSQIANAAHFLPTTSNEKLIISHTDTGHGKPFVLIHAFPTDQRLWVSQVEGLKDKFRVITLDLWGFGGSSAANGQAITMEEYATEVKKILDRLHIHKAIIGGESMGGYVALAFLKKYPHQVNGLVLSDTQSIADSPETKAKREQTAVDVLENGTDQFIQGFMPKALSSSASDETKAFLQDMLEDQAATAMASASRGMALREDTSDVLAKTMVPVLILTGEEDTLISPTQSENMHALAKNSRLIIIKNAGHLSSLEQPEQWNQAVLDLFD